MSVVIRKVDWLLGATVGLCWTMLVLLSLGLAAVVATMPALWLARGHVLAKHVGQTTLTDGQKSAMVVLLLGAALAIVLALRFVRTLLDIVRSVGTGDPLTTENAARLETMGWLALAVQGVGLALNGVGKWLSLRVGDLPVPRTYWEGDIDLSTVVLVLLLFVLARVFRSGAAMRADLEGTV